MPYALAILPFALVAAASALWRQSLARPWIYFFLANAALYSLIVVVVVVANHFFMGAYFLEARVPGPDAPRPSPLLVDAFTLTVLAAVAVFVAIGGLILWALKLWMAKP
jgi:hypothetical protein